MFSYTTRNVYVLTIFFTLVIFNIINYFLVNISNLNQTKEIGQVEITKIHFDKLETKEIKTISNLGTGLYQEVVWKIEIPKINLEAGIAEGTTDEVMNKYVGHFENTPIFNGNPCLAAHNRGYPVNYFGRLKELTQDDLIIYKTTQGTRKYKVSLITVIKDTDWSNLRNTNDNRITLITCVENQPEYRRCIQATEII
ncbi:MAG: class D sortase [Clostridia bacterium]|nr:class D sortase [Clostridia bacterium]